MKNRYPGGLRHVRENLFCLGHGCSRLLRDGALLVWVGPWSVLVKAQNLFSSS